MLLVVGVALHPVLDCILDPSNPSSWDVAWASLVAQCEASRPLSWDGSDGAGRARCRPEATEQVIRVWEGQHEGRPRTDHWPCDLYPKPDGGVGDNGY